MTGSRRAPTRHGRFLLACLAVVVGALVLAAPSVAVDLSASGATAAIGTSAATSQPFDPCDDWRPWCNDDNDRERCHPRFCDDDNDRKRCHPRFCDDDDRERCHPRFCDDDNDRRRCHPRFCDDDNDRRRCHPRFCDRDLGSASRAHLAGNA